MLVTTTQSAGTRSRSETLITPRGLQPLAPPHQTTKQVIGGVGVGLGMVWAKVFAAPYGECQGQRNQNKVSYGLGHAAFKVNTTGAWSLGRSFLRGNLSIAQAPTCVFKDSLTKM